ncbi:unnamed protein product [Zymoseptoria tritici ST99CH_1A5]|uniref:DUF7605 domain-containing protein n=1 Tax=Zymoseptoria tritici ST99CH_1A5 TaxID=1276529 RepID=A0A1Y6LBC4_ZYMTR|nr:unnamed protein product [Zymoseptoria tritici ST99CH_1A5]
MEATGSRDRSVESDSNIQVSRKRSLSESSTRVDRERSETPSLFVEEIQAAPHSRQDSAHAEQTAEGPQFSEEPHSDEEPQTSEEVQSTEEPHSSERNTDKHAPKRIATTSNAVAAPYSLDNVVLDEEGRVPGYNINAEPLPLLAIFHPSFKLAEKDATTACDLVINVFEELVAGGYRNDEVAVVCGDRGLAACRNPSEFYPEIGPVAVLGPAGSGKSSAINSMLSQKKAAFEHDGDDRGTYVPAEYCAPQQDQTTPYRLVAIYYSVDEIERSIVASFGDIRAMLVEPDEDSLDDSEDEVLKQKFDTAVGFFTDLLCSNKQFRTPAETHAYFEDRLENGDTEDEVCGDLIDLVHQFLELRDACDDEKEVYDIQDENELHRILKQVSRPTRVQGQQRPSPWPLLQKVVVHQAVPILTAGVVIADTPGFNDQNLIVAGNTTRYLKQAGTILIFLSYKRIQQNSPLDHLIRVCISLGKMYNIRLVITMIDDMKPHTEDEKDDLEVDEKARLDKAEAALRLLVIEIKENEVAKRAARGRDNNKFAQLDDELAKLAIRKKQAEVSQRQTSTDIRCRALHRSLVSRIKNIEKSKNAPELRISFLSNTQYQRHVAGYEPLDAPCLSLLGTGVPSLRRELFSVPTFGKLQNLKGLATTRLPNVLMGVEGILFKSHLERKADVGRTIKLALKKYHRPAEKLVDDVLTAFDTYISNVVKDSLPGWMYDAQKLLCKWGDEVPAGTFKAVCQRGGTWIAHKKLGDIKWNAALLDLSANQLSQGFNKLTDEVEVLRKDFATNVKNSFDQLRVAVEISKDAQGKDMALFYKFVNGTARAVVEEMNGRFDDLNDSISHVRHLMTLDSDDSYLASAMKSTWEEASLVSKANSTPVSGVKNPSGARRKRPREQVLIHGAREHVIASKLRGDAPNISAFQSVQNFAHEDFKGILKSWAEACEITVKEASDNILAFFDTHFRDTEDMKTEDPVAIAKLKKAVDAAKQIVEVSMIQHLAECEAYEQSG